MILCRKILASIVWIRALILKISLIIAMKIPWVEISLILVSIKISLVLEILTLILKTVILAKITLVLQNLGSSYSDFDYGFGFG